MPYADQIADLIYDVLVLECGASNSADARSAFVASINGGCEEYRFQGNLGFGGKLYIEADRWRVGCYPEDSTSAIRAMIGRANVRLKALRSTVAV